MGRNCVVGIATDWTVQGSNPCRSRWLRPLSCRSMVVRLLGLRVRISPGEWMFVLCVLYIRGKRQRAGQSGRRTADKVKRENKKIPVGAIFSAPVHTGPGAHPSSYKMGTGYLSSGVNRPGRGVNPRPPPSGAIPLLPLWDFMACFRWRFIFYSSIRCICLKQE